MRVLVVGSDGLIGKSLTRHLRIAGHQVIETTRRKERLASDDVLLFDLEDEDFPLTSLPKFDAAIICAAVTTFAACRNAPERAQQINVNAPVRLARHVQRLEGRTILLSTSAVFDCLEPHMTANRPLTPKGAYGRFKAEAETGVQATRGGTILRLTKVLTPGRGMIHDWIVEMACGRPVRAFGDHSFCPVAVDDVSVAVRAILESGETGIFQVSGTEDVTYFAAARFLAKHLDCAESLVGEISAADQGIPLDEIATFTSLDVSRLARLSGFRPPSPETILSRMLVAATAGAARLVRP